MARVVRTKNVLVKFIRSHAVYSGGDRAGFHADQAAALVRAGVAEYVVTDVPAAPVAKAPPPPPVEAEIPQTAPEEKPKRRRRKKKTDDDASA